ncbi:MAG: hypothetical protein ACP5NZ_00985 [Nanobdellota archaeon]
MGDKYLSELEKAKENLNNFKKGYQNTLSVPENMSQNYPLKQGLNQKNFKYLLGEAAKSGDIFSALDTVSLYGYKSSLPINRPTVKRLLIKAFNNSKLDKASTTRAYNSLKQFLKTHPESEEVKNPLEKILNYVGIFLILGSLFFLSSNITGNVVGLTSKTSNFIGIPLFIVGLGLVIFCSRKK